MPDVTFHLEVFEGPLDLLLHLISKNKVDIKDIPISLILEQYLEHINIIKNFDLDIASDFIAMAAQLMLIKSKMLLPVHSGDEAEDPREELVQALLEYQRFKELSGFLSEKLDFGKNIFVKPPEARSEGEKIEYRLKIGELLKAADAVLERLQRKEPPPVSAFSEIARQNSVPVSDKIKMIINLFKKSKVLDFEMILSAAKSRSEIVAVFLAVLELSNDSKIVIYEQSGGYMLKLAGG